MSTWNLRAASVVAALLLFLAGCTGAPREVTLTAAAGPGQDITVAAIPASDLGGLYVALDQGLFARQGLHVKITKIPSSQAVIAAQLSGHVDISAGSYVPYIAAQAAGARFRILAEASTLQPDTRALVVPAYSGITSLAGLVGKKIGVNGTNSIGTLLISALLEENGIPPGKVDFVTDNEGFPTMPGQLDKGEWQAAFLAEPYVTIAGEQYGDQILADLDQGATMSFPIDGYVATQAWTRQHPKAAAAFVRAIEQGQAIAASDPAAARAAIGQADQLPPQVTGVMMLPDYPVGPVDEKRIQREAAVMLQFGTLGRRYATEIEQGTLVRSMTGPAPAR
ncbi:MAG: ABC transporter substrate-binding protein [Streptosporangiaceae bacterium]|jgi:NitT/TauT family transport system substrate-binding protein